MIEMFGKHLSKCLLPIYSVVSLVHAYWYVCMPDTCLHMADLGMDGVVCIRHGELEKHSIVVGSPQLALDWAVHLHGGKVYLVSNEETKKHMHVQMRKQYMENVI